MQSLDGETATSRPIMVKKLATLEEAEACEDLQVEIWPTPENSAGYCIPIHMLVTQMEIGGIVLGAYDKDQMVGFIYSSQEQDKQGRHYHYSWLAGVKPGYRHAGIMAKLKGKHFELAARQPVYKIVWTYDPLQGPNANLNVKKLGGIVQQYKVNYYGMRAGGSPQNIGIPSDRFLLEWYISAQHTLQRLAGGPANATLTDLMISEECQLVNRVGLDHRMLPVIEAYDLELASRQLLVEIPGNFEQIRAHPAKGKLDLEWRLKTREIFSRYIVEKGYTVVDFFSETHQGRRRNFYLLEKDFVVE